MWPISPRILKRYEGFADWIVFYFDEQSTIVILKLRDPEGGRVRGSYLGSQHLNEPDKARLVGSLNRLCTATTCVFIGRKASIAKICGRN